MFKQKNAVYLVRLCMCKGAFKTISTDREIVELPVESSEVQLQCVFLSLCGSPGSQVFPVKILPVIWQALIMLYIWTDATYSPWQKRKILQSLQWASHFTGTVTFYVYHIQWTNTAAAPHIIKSASMQMTSCYTYKILISHYKKYSSLSTLSLQFYIEQ